MTFPERILDSVRRSRRTLYLIAGAYVLIGFGVAVPAAMNGDRLTTFLGFLIVSGALAAAVVIGNIVRLSIHLSAIGRRLEEVRDRLDRLEFAHRRAEQVTSSAWPVQVLDLATVGDGDPSPLVSATLDRDQYPRLADAMEGAAAATDRPRGGEGRDPPTTPLQTSESTLPPAEDDLSGGSIPGVTNKNLIRQWRVGMRNGDVASCREVFAALVDVADPETVSSYRTQLEELSARTERGLRQTFREHFLRRDYPAMLEVGEQICRLFPDRPAAEQFHRIKAALFQRCVESVGLGDDSGTPATEREQPSLRVVY